MNKVSHSLATTVILLPLTLGPFWLGSYYAEWRWPLLYSAIASIFTALALPFFSHNKGKKHPLSAALTNLATLTLICMGLFMWYNSWGEFHTTISQRGHYLHWEITPVENQAYYDLPGSADKNEAWDRLSYIIPCLLLILSFRQLTLRRILKLQTLCATIFWTGVGIAILGLLQRFTEADAIFWNDDFFNKQQPLFFATFRSPAIAASYLNICLAIGLSHLLSVTQLLTKKEKPTPTHPTLISVGLTIIFAGSICAGSKAGAVFAIATLLLWAVMNARTIIRLIRNAPSLFPSGSHHERNIVVGAAIIAFSLTALSFAGTVIERWEKAEKGNFDTLQQRETANAVQIVMIQDPQWSKVAGFGPGSFYPLFHYYKQNTDLKSAWVYAHNDHLQTLVEWGWLGTGCFVILIGGGGMIALFSGFKKKRGLRYAEKLYARGFALAMLICLLHATVDFPFQIESIAITFAIILGAAWALPSLRANTKPLRKSHTKAVPTK